LKPSGYLVDKPWILDTEIWHILCRNVSIGAGNLKTMSITFKARAPVGPRLESVAFLARRPQFHARPAHFDKLRRVTEGFFFWSTRATYNGIGALMSRPKLRFVAEGILH
jgi:hypothetical protein